MSTTTCRSCQRPIGADINFCPHCGASQTATVTASPGAPTRRRLTAKSLLLGVGALLVLCVGLALVAPGGEGNRAAPAAPTGTTAPLAEAATVPAPRQPVPTATPRSTNAPALTATPSPTSRPRVVTTEQWPLVLSDPEAFKGSTVTITGRIFVNPERDRERVVFQMFTDPEASSGNTIVSFKQADFALERHQYVRVTGTIRGRFEGHNAFGASLSAPTIEASQVDVISRAEAVAPAYETITLDRTVTQHGLAVTLVKVELSTKETRAYVKVKNGSPVRASAYDYQAVIVQDGRQIKRKSLFDAGYPEVDDTLQPGTESEGILVFEPVNQHIHTFQLIWPGVRTDNYRLDFADYAWEVTW